MGKGFFGNLFDFNGDGNLDAAEHAADFILFDEMIQELDESADDDDEDDNDSDEDDF